MKPTPRGAETTVVKYWLYKSRTEQSRGVFIRHPTEENVLNHRGREGLPELA